MDNIVFSQYEDVGGGSDLTKRQVGDEEILQMLDQRIDNAILTHDIDPVISEIANLRQAARIVGIALVHLLGRIAENWSSFGINEDPIDYLYAETGVSKTTVDRYIKVYKMLKEAPEDLRPQLQQMNVKALIPVGYALAQGHVLEDKDWKEVVAAGTYDEVAFLMREVKGSRPRTSGLRMWVNRKGEVFSFASDEDGNEERRFICVLPVESGDPIIEKSVERMIRNSGMMVEWEV